MALHEDLVCTAGDRWDRPPPRPVVWGPLHRGVRDAYIATFSGRPVWGFKDRRLVFALDGWLEALPALESVAIFRHPTELAESLRRRSPGKVTAMAALDLGLAYNRHLLEWPTRLGCPVVEYLPNGAAFNRAADVAPVHAELRARAARPLDGAAR